MVTFTHLEHPQLPTLRIEQSALGKRFYITPNENKYPSITTVLGAKEKPYLQEWQKMLGQSEAKKETKRCSDRGTAIHELVEQYLNNTENFTKGYNCKYVNGFNQLKLQLNHINNIRTQEAALYSDTLKVAGRVDCIGEYKGALSVIDFKTSTNIKKPNMIEDYFKQATAYAIMWHELTEELITDIVILISVERGIMPQVFTDKVDNWIEPLLVDIHKYQTQ